MQVQLSYTPIVYSSKQFSDLVEKRVKKALRSYNINVAKPLYLFNDGSKEYIVALFLLKKILPPQLKLLSVKKKQFPLVQPTNMERELNIKFQQLIEHKPFKEKKEILFMDCLLEEEMVAYAKIHKITIPVSKEPLNSIIAQVQKKYPETKFSLYNSLKNMKSHQL
jgi:hypothetical protein